MGMDVSGPVKDIDEYSVTEVTQNNNGLRHAPGAEAGEHIIIFPYGSELYLTVLNNDGIMSLEVSLVTAAGYSSPRGLCNIPGFSSSDNMLMGSDGNSYDPEKEDEVAAFANSWKVKDEDVLTNFGAGTSIPPTQQPGTICKFPEYLQPKLTSTATATGSTTVDFSTYVSSTTVDFSTYVSSTNVDISTTVDFSTYVSSTATGSTTTVDFSTYVSSFTVDLSTSTSSSTADCYGNEASQSGAGSTVS
ncbi:hypothetical protein BASA81_013107 [Batrachochytrium salamandrivorans]|nr:hypothetical protein BASA81_013107 [Batrachochytrium salamandrivorans]